MADKALHYTKRQLVRDARLNADDLAAVQQGRRPHNRLGFAYQIGFVRLFNRLPAQQTLEIVGELLAYISAQVDLTADLIHEYHSRQQTISEHQQRIVTHLGCKRFDEAATERLEQFLFEESFHLEQTAAHQAKAKEYLKDLQVLLPADYVLNRIIGQQRARAREHIFAKLTARVPDHVVGILDQLLEVLQDQAVSDLQKIKANPSQPSVDSMRSLIQKLDTIETTGVLEIDLSWLNNNYQRDLFHYVRKCSVDRLREVTPSRRHAAMVCFLWPSYRDAVDQVVDMFEKLLTRTQDQVKNDLDEQLKRQRQAIKLSLTTLQSLGRKILDDSIGDDKLRAAIFEEISKDELASQVENLSKWVSGRRSEVFAGVVKRYGYLRKFSPVLVEALAFSNTSQDAASPCLEAVETLRQVNADAKRKLPDDVRTGFAQDLEGRGLRQRPRESPRLGVRPAREAAR